MAARRRERSRAWTAPARQTAATRDRAPILHPIRTRSARLVAADTPTTRSPPSSPKPPSLRDPTATESEPAHACGLSSMHTRTRAEGIGCLTVDGQVLGEGHSVHEARLAVDGGVPHGLVVHLA